MASRAIRKLLLSGEQLDEYTETQRDRDKDQLERRQILEEMTRNMADTVQTRSAHRCITMWCGGWSAGHCVAGAP